MKTYYIYHIEGVKVGCTSNLQKRMADQGFTSWNILEEHTDIIEASNREIQLQKEYGLPVDTIPYYISVQNRSKWTNETRHVLTSEDRSKSHETNKINNHYSKMAMAVSHESRSKGGKTTGPIQGRKNANQINTCVHCNKTIKGLNYKRWHGDNCKLNPQKGL